MEKVRAQKLKSRNKRHNLTLLALRRAEVVRNLSHSKATQAFMILKISRRHHHRQRKVKILPWKEFSKWGLGELGRRCTTQKTFSEQPTSPRGKMSCSKGFRRNKICRWNSFIVISMSSTHIKVRMNRGHSFPTPVHFWISAFYRISPNY